MVMMLLVFLIWQSFFGPEPPVPGEEGTPAVEQAADQAETPAVKKEIDPNSETAKTEAATPGIQTAPGSSDEQPAFESTASVETESMLVENDLYTATVSNDGAVISSWRLKKYKDKPGEKAVPYEMIWTAHSEKYSLATEFGSDKLLLYPDDDYTFIEKGKNKVVLQRVTPTGLQVTKTFEFSDENYVVNLTVDLKNVAAEPLQGTTTLLTYSKAEKVKHSFFAPPANIIHFMADIDGKVQKEEVSKLVEPTDFPGQALDWSGFSGKYFFIGVAPGNPKQSIQKAKATAEGVAESQISSFNKKLDPGQSAQYKYLCYMGPKLEDKLMEAKEAFYKSRDFGWFSGIARMLVRVLNFFFKYVHNYGIAIIILTIIIKIMLLPLTHKSFKSMKAMQDLAPEMKALREQLGDDRNALNQKTMELYKKHKVNPASGCLPMLVQLPIFIAFYRALYSSIELRHTPFFGWIQDLSAPDPYYITPILMGATMVLTQKLTPSSADPMQQKMMMAMPIVFTFLFLSFPSGLVVYWLMSNILSIFQQLYLYRSNPKDKEMVPATATAGPKGKKK